ncbi:MAG: GNAT family N-acetyltransferase [Ignavibacteriaceae bacterium]|nr:GNAT family N-acetyltransferase [Ignavibacteriaceae bacterium]
MNSQFSISKLKFKPLTIRNWQDFEILFGKNGACAGCWCMYWLMRRKDYDEKRKRGKTKTEMKMLVRKGLVPGIIAYEKNIPIGWIAIQPRENYPVLQNSKVLQRVDNEKVWAIVCFFVHKDYRHRSISVKMINAAVDYAKSKKAYIVEGYPVQTKNNNAPPLFIYTGTYSAFKRANFIEVARRSETRPIMRCYLK